MNENMNNTEIAKIFREMAEFLEIKGENLFRIRAFQKVAQNIENLNRDIAEIAGRGELQSIPGIGKGMAKRIEEFLKTGKLKEYRDLKKEFPPGLMEMLSVPELGPKTAKLLYDKLGIRSIKGLEEAAKEHKIQGLFRLGVKVEENILRGIEVYQRQGERMLLFDALRVVHPIIEELSRLPEVKLISEAGSLRRRKETIGDIDILTASASPKAVIKAFTNLAEVREILAKGETKSSVCLNDGLQVDLRVVKPNSFGAALVYFTGSKSHNIKIRDMARRKGLKVSEYGVFKVRGNKRVAGKTEEEIYQSLGLSWIPPELREDRGEVEVALKKGLPELVEVSDIKGDFHVHSRWSDGADSIEEIAEAARERGYQYLVVADHSQSLKVARGLSVENLKKKIRAIRQLNKRFKAFTLLAGTEVDIKSDGSLDYPDSILAELDVVIAAIHSGFKQKREQLTSRILMAMENRYVNIIAHPTGRLMGARDGYDLDFDKIFKQALDTKTALEINAFPERLDLNDLNVHRAKNLGVKLAIGTDAHILNQLASMELGVSVARRGWLGKRDLLNTLSLAELMKWLKKG